MKYSFDGVETGLALSGFIIEDGVWVHESFSFVFNTNSWDKVEVLDLDLLVVDTLTDFSFEAVGAFMNKHINDANRTDTPF